MKSPVGLEVIKAKSLSERTSIGIGGCPLAEVRVHDESGLAELSGVLRDLGGRPAVFGRGTNILAADNELPITLINPPKGSEPVTVGQYEDKTLVRCGAGASLPSMLAFAAGNELAGLSGLAGIPGSIGGAIFMNAGSFGTEIGRLVHCIEIFSPEGGLTQVRADELEFSYRKCRVKNLDADALWFIIVSATLALTKGPGQAIREHMRECLQKKQTFQPIASRSAGCIFKNPAPDAPAGRLIDQAGLKGKSVGGMSFSEIHANFLVNNGHGSFAQAMELIETAREKVQALSGHFLELEVRLWQ